MPDRSSKPKRPKDANQLAKLVAEIAYGATKDPVAPTDAGKDPAAVALGRKGGLKGGKSRAAKLSARRRSQIARMAARARYNKND
jgi:hypothetical protein